VIYREYISDRNHFHMNSTIWETLTDFVMYLGRTGKCEVDETEKGWFVTYIDRDPETLRRLEARAKRERSELDSEEKHQRDLERQVKIARSLEGGGQPPAPTELKRADPSEKVAFGIPASSKPAAAKAKLPSCALFSADEAPVDTAPSSASASSSALPAGAKSRTSGIQALIAEDMKRKEASARSKYWLRTDIVVKVMNKTLRDGKYYKQKGVIEKVVERDAAHVRMNASGDLIKVRQAARDARLRVARSGAASLLRNATRRDAQGQCDRANPSAPDVPARRGLCAPRGFGSERFLSRPSTRRGSCSSRPAARALFACAVVAAQVDQMDLETVIPSEGGRVVFVNGAFRGERARLLSINVDRFCVSVKIDGGQHAGRVVDGVEYEDVCKSADASSSSVRE